MLEIQARRGRKRKTPNFFEVKSTREPKKEKKPLNSERRKKNYRNISCGGGQKNKVAGRNIVIIALSKRRPSYLRRRRA